MTCAACSRAVERTVKKVEGVSEGSVNLATEKLNVTFDENKTNLDIIIAAIEKAGYKAGVESTSATLKIGGMTCAACSKAVERNVRKLDGVVEGNVNLATEKLTVIYEPSKLRLSDIKAAIVKAGYKVIEEETTVDQDKENKEKEIKNLWNRFLVSAIFTVPLLFISMAHMLGYMLPEFFDPMKNPMNFAVSQLILVIPVIIAGSKFFKVGFKTLFMRSPNMDSLIMVAVFGARPISFLIASEVLPLVTDSKYFPRVIKVKIVAADSKYNS